MIDGVSVIVLGVDNPMGLAVVRDLGRHGARVIALGNTHSALGLQSRWCHHAAIRERDSNALALQIEALADAFDCEVLLTISESDIQWVNDHRDRLEVKLRCAVPSTDTMDVVLNKDMSQKLATQIGIDVPTTRIVDPDIPIESQVLDLSYPVVLKWANPHEVIASLSAQELELKKYEYCYNQQDLLHKLALYQVVGHFPMIQEFVPGYGLGHFFLVRNGEVLLRFQHRRLHEWPPDGGVSTLCESLPLDQHTDALARSETLITSLEWEGVAMVEYRYNPDANRYVFMEVNGRFWGSLPLAVAAGVPFAWGLVTPEINSVRSLSSYRSGLKARFLIPELRRLIKIVFHPQEIQNKKVSDARLYEVFKFIRLYFDTSVRYFVFDWQDQKPFWVDLKLMVGKAIKKLFS